VDLITALLLLSVAAAPLALLSGWLAGRGSRPLGSLVNAGDSDTWWRSTMPWPRGVQEEDDLTWSFRDTPPAATQSLRSRPHEADEIRVDPIHLRPQVRRR
jgi:hypothetical protein